MIYKELLKKVDDIENLKEVDNIKCTTNTGEYTIENSKKGYLTNFSIQGKTLVNLANPNNIYTTDGVRYNNPFKYIESGKTYTFVNLCDKQIKYTYGGIGNVVVQANSKILYTIPSNVLDIPAMMCYGHTTEGWGETDLDKQKISKAMLVLEGDYTSEDIDYFNGLQSVGQVDNIELLSYKSDANLFDGEFRNGSYIDDGSFYADNNATSNKNFIMVDGNEKYSINYDLDVTGKIFEYDENKKYIKSTAITNAFSFTTSEKTKYINFFIGTNSVGYSPCIKFMINFGEIKEYEPYKYDKKSITHTLRSLPSGVKDEIIYKNGCYKLIQRCGEINQNGQGNWILHANSTDNTLLFYTPITEGSYNNTNNIDLYCNRFKAGLIFETTSNYEGIYETKTNIWIRILRSRLTTQDLAGFKTWLSNNNVTLVRQLKESKEIQLNTLNLEQYNNQTKFICNTGAVIPSINFESTQNLGSHIEVIRGTLKEVFQCGVNAKNNVVTALASKGAEVTTSDTWEEIKTKIDNKEGRLDLREVRIATFYTPCLVTNGTIKYIEKYAGDLKALEHEESYFYAIKGTHLIKINAIDESVIFDITLANANFSCLCITQNYLFMSDNTKLYKIDKSTGIEVQSIANTYYKLCAYGDFIYGIYGSDTSSTLHKIRVSDMYIMLTKNLSSDSIYNFERGKFVCNKNGIYATTEHSANPSSYTACYLSKINFDFTIAKSFGIGGHLYNKNIKFMNDFVFVSDTSGSIGTSSSSNTSALVKYDANLNYIGSADIRSCVNFELYKGYVYMLFSSVNYSDPFQKLDSNTLKPTQYCTTFYKAIQVDDMIIINNMIFFINSNGIYRNIVSRKVYSDEKGEEL